MTGIDEIYTERDKQKSAERAAREQEEAYDRMEENLAEELEVSPDHVVKAERTDLEREEILFSMLERKILRLTF